MQDKEVSGMRGVLIKSVLNPNTDLALTGSLAAFNAAALPDPRGAPVGAATVCTFFKAGPGVCEHCSVGIEMHP